MSIPEPIHPGEHLAEIMSELGVTQYRLAKTIGVPQMRIHEIVHRRRSVTADTALRLGKALGMTPELSGSTCSACTTSMQPVRRST